MDQNTILYTKISLCYDILNFREMLESVTRSTEQVQHVFNDIHTIDLFKNVYFDRIDIQLQNKVFELLRNFNKLGIDPIFAQNNSKEVISGMYFNKYLLPYFCNKIFLIIEMQSRIISSIDGLLVRYRQIYEKNKIRILFSSKTKRYQLFSKDEELNNLFSEIDKLIEEYNKILDSYNNFDLKNDFLDIVDYNLKSLIDYQKLNPDFNLRSLIDAYSVDYEFMKKIGLEDRLGELKEIYLHYLDGIVLPEELDSKDGEEDFFIDKIESEDCNLSDVLKLSKDDLMLELYKSNFALILSSIENIDKERLKKE